MTAFDKKVNQIAARHGWNIEKQARAAVPCYIIAAPTYEDAGKIVAVLNRPRKTPRKNRPTENRQQKRGKRGAGRVYLFFRVILPGRSFFRGVVRGGRLESIAGHSFPRGVHDIPRHAFPGVGGGGVQILFNFFRDSN